MRPASAAVLLMAVVMTACTTTSGSSSGAVLPDASQQSPERYVVVTVRNDHASGGMRAASTTRGYDGIRPYSVSDSARAIAGAIATDYGLREAGSWPIPLLGVHCVVFEMPAQSDQASLLGRLARDRRVESAQPLTSFTTQTSSYNDPYAGLQQSLGQMAIAQAQQWSQGEGVVLAVIDTGVDTGHPDLQGRVAQQRNFVNGDEAAFRSDLHGTAVAGVIAAVANNRIGIAGIAPDVRLLAFKACWQVSPSASTSACNTFTLAQALAAAIDARVDIVNLSLAGPADPLLTRIVEQGLRRGIIFVGAAPPAGAHVGFPGDISGVITVDAPDRKSGGAAALIAPGHDVLTLVPQSHYDFASGSSLAAAQVSAVVALLLARDHHLNGGAVQRLLARTSRSVQTPAGSFTTVDACEALVSLQQHGSCAPVDAGDPPLDARSR